MIVGDHRQLTQRIAAIRVHSAKASKHLIAAEQLKGAEQDEAWLSALEEVRKVMDLVTGTRALFGRLSTEANRAHELKG